MLDKSSPEPEANSAILLYRASQETTWVSDPANPVETQSGSIGEGELIWLLEPPFGSGPTWQAARPGLARLRDGSVCFVQPHHFNETTP